MRRLASWRWTADRLTAIFMHQYYSSIFCNETNLGTWRKQWFFVWMIQISRILQILANTISEVFWTLIQQALSIWHIGKKKSEDCYEMYSVLGLVRHKVHCVVMSVCTGRKAALCSALGSWREVEDLWITGLLLCICTTCSERVRVLAGQGLAILENLCNHLEKHTWIVLSRQFLKLLQGDG